ncbi:MAG TPA: DUF5602 domain-containing protein [Leptolyngbyaceae cyanobacterium M65_K2018_010]|nr:DUF5602 domain-containing protein [Leptolyngbyaceae cyanobacterium M65_K2018_010]
MMLHAALISITGAVLVAVSGFATALSPGTNYSPQPLAASGVKPTTVSSPAVMVEGVPQPLGSGTVRAYVSLNEAGQSQELGVIFSAAALSNLPSTTTEVLLPLPPQAASTAIDHIAVDWQPHGHIPDPIYGMAHFDIHAYTISPEAREAITIDAAGLERAYRSPASELIPAGYVLAPDSAEPRMGSHWVDPTSPEFQGEPHGFSHTLIYGFYDGAMVFIEPMVNLEFLQSQATYEGAFPVPQTYSKPGLYPSHYRIDYNPQTQEHIVALTEFQ